MTDIVQRATVMAVVVESTEGTPVAPTSAAEYVKLQDDFDMSPEFESLTNAELSSSIGMSKSIRGTEAPTFSFSHYLKHSGTEGATTDFDELIQACFGTETVAGAEYNTVSGSTVSVINVDTGEGTNFGRGHPLLIKDPVNGYRIRPVHSVATDALTLGFQLPTGKAPGTGVDLGDAIYYSPADTGHQTLTIWNYMGNEGSIQMMTGARVVGMSITADAGQLVNCNYSLEGIGYYFNPIEITSSDIYLDFDEDGMTELSAAVTAQFYKDPHDLASALQTAMNAVATAAITVTYNDSDGKFTIASDGGTLNLLWNTGSNTANTIGDKIGFSVAADDTGTTTYTSDNAQSYAAPQTPSYDSSDPIAAKGLEVLIGDSDDTACFEASSVSIEVSTPKASKPSLCSSSGVSGSIITNREITVSVSAYLQKFDADKFRRYRANTDTRFLLNVGEKSGGNWVKGKCVSCYGPSMTVDSFDLAEVDGLVTVDFTLKAYVDNDGNGEFYIGFV